MPTEAAPGWLAEALERCVRENWCIQRRCTTCGCPEMRSLLVGREKQRGERFIRIDELTSERTKALIDEMARLDDPRFEDAMMWLRFGEEAHAVYFQPLRHSFAGAILMRMNHHFHDVHGGPAR